MSDSCSSITAVHPDIIQTHILTKLDGPTLVSASSVSTQLHTLCSEENLWKTICNSNWPSTTDSRIQQIISKFPSAYRSFYSDSYPTIRISVRPKENSPELESTKNQTGGELISAIDIHYGTEIIYSKVIFTDTSKSWFLSSPLRIDLLDSKEIVPTPAKFDGDEKTCMARMEKNMRLSWILIDPVKNRAVNLSSLTPVEVRRHWLTGEIQVRYTTVMAAGIGGGFVKCGVDVTCGGKGGGDLHVREISMQVEDLEGKVLSGKESMGILLDAMEGKRVNGKIDENIKMYQMFSEMRVIWRERRQKRERRLDMVCIASGVTIFMAFWMFIFFR